MNECKRLSDCPADRLAQCRGKVVLAAESGQWKMVPVIATEEMIRFANVAVPKTPNAQWNAMLAAAPVPPASDGCGHAGPYIYQPGIGWTPAGDVEVFSLSDVVCQQSNGAPGKLTGKVILEGKYRAHVTRLTAERDGLSARLEEALVDCEANRHEREVVCANYEVLKAELTKTQEAITKIAMWPDGGNAYGQDKIKAFANRILSGTELNKATEIAHQSTHNVDESCGQDAEAAKGDNWRMNPCKQGHRDVGACQGTAFCYICDETITAATTQEAFEQWNATHPATPQ